MLVVEALSQLTQLAPSILDDITSKSLEHVVLAESMGLVLAL